MVQLAVMLLPRLITPAALMFKLLLSGRTRPTVVVVPVGTEILLTVELKLFKLELRLLIPAVLVTTWELTAVNVELRLLTLD